jgi:hypothetical protein
MNRTAQWALAMTVVLVLLTACSTGRPAMPGVTSTTATVTRPAPSPSTPTQNQTEASAVKIPLTIGQRALEATLLDNATARDFASLLPLTVHMNDLFGKEKYGPLPRALAAGQGQSSYEVGDFGFWSPGPDIAVYYHHDGEPIPDPGIVMIGKVTGLVDALPRNNGTVDITFSAQN